MVTLNQANSSVIAALDAVPEWMMKRSIHEDCRHEEDKFKWLESEKAGRDLGEAAVFRWVREHWAGYLRAKWIEHLQGKCFWTELDRGDFGLLLRQLQDQHHLLVPILDRLKAGQENLDIILWATQERIPLADVCRILELLDVNSTRLLHRFDEQTPRSH
jgi:hypothetical protein